MNKIERKSKIIWNLESLQTFLLFFVGIVIIYFFFGDIKWVWKLLVIGSLYLFFNIIRDLISHHFAFKNTEYELSNEILYIKNGGLIKYENTIPLNRIQHSDIEQSFYSRIFNLYAINIYTAGDTHTIEYVKRDVADELKDKIIKIITKVTVEHEEEKRPYN